MLTEPPYNSITKNILYCKFNLLASSGTWKPKLLNSLNSSSVNLNGTYYAKGFLSRTGDLNKIVERLVVKKFYTIVNQIGLDGLLWGFFLLMGIVMLGIYRPSLGILFGVVGVVFLWMIQLVEITLTAIVSIIAIGIVLLVGVGKQWTTKVD